MRKLYSIEIEQAVLACVMLDNDLAQALVGLSREDTFFTGDAIQTYKAICQLTASNVPCDPVSVSEITGNLDYCIDACRNNPSTKPFYHWLNTLKDYAKERELYRFADLVKGELLENDEATTTDRVQAIEAAFTALSAESTPTTTHTLKTAVQELIEHLEWQNENPDYKGVLSGLDHYDQRIGGYNGGEMIVIAGTPGSGKTTHAMQIARYACENGKRVMVFSLEMPKKQLAQRMMSASHSIPLGAFKDGSAYQSREHSVKLAPAAVHAAKLDMVIDDQGGLDILDMKSRARMAHREKKLDAIVIDYMQLLNDRRHKDRFQAISSISREIKALAKELDIPIIALSQLNRGVMNRTDKRPQLSDLRESGQIEQDADVITFIYREFIFNEQCDNPHGVELITRKFRDGETGTDYAEFEGQFNRFINTQWIPREEPKKGGRFNL